MLNQYVHTHEEFKTYTAELFSLVQQGVIKLSVFGEYALTTEGITAAQVDICESFLS